MSGQLESLRAFVGSRSAGGQQGLPHVVVLAAGKGGVGASTVSALLAAAAADRGRSTLLVDAAPSAGSLGALLGLEEVEQTEEARFLRPSLSFAAPALQGARGSGERRARLRRIAGRYADYDLVVVDAGASAETVADALACGAGRLLAVATTERLSVVAAYALVKFAVMRVPDLPIAVLINRCEPGDAARLFGTVAAGAEEFLGRAIVPAGAIPEDDTLRDAGDQGFSPASSTGSAAHAAGLLVELLLNAAAVRSDRPPLLRTT